MPFSPDCYSTEVKDESDRWLRNVRLEQVTSISTCARRKRPTPGLSLIRQRRDTALPTGFLPPVAKNQATEIGAGSREQGAGKLKH